MLSDLDDRLTMFCLAAPRARRQLIAGLSGKIKAQVVGLSVVAAISKREKSVKSLVQLSNSEMDALSWFR